MQMSGPKNARKSIPSESVLLTIAIVTLSETDRTEAASRWTRELVFGDREKHLLAKFWEALDTSPPKVEVTEIRPRHVTYK